MDVWPLAVMLKYYKTVEIGVAPVRVLDRLRLIRMSVRIKMMLTFAMAVGVVWVATILYTFPAVESKLKDLGRTKLESDLALGWAWLDARYPGQWRVEGDRLYKGNTLINDNHAIVDAVAQMTGGTVTLFRGDTRVATNVLDAGGQRLVGTKADPQVVETVLQRGQPFRGVAEVAGNTNHTAYQPIQDSGGKVIGMWYVGVPHSIYHALMADFRRNIILAGIAGTLFSLAVGWFVAWELSVPIRRLREAMARVKEGDLTGRVHILNRDEMGVLAGAYNAMLDSLEELVQKVMAVAGDLTSTAQQLKGVAEETTRAAESIASTIQQVAVGAENQARSVEATSATIGELTKGVQGVAKLAERVTAQAADGVQTAAAGGEAAGRAANQMHTISLTVNQSAALVAKLGQQSRVIGQIVDTITTIADQTNLLALNAAIEAARAGEQGRGFAVVAEEVRKLAEQAGQAAGHITELVREIQAGTDKAVQGMAAGTREVENGLQVVNAAQEAFNTLVGVIGGLEQRFREVADTTARMVDQSRAATEAMDSIAAVSAQTAASAEDVAASAEEESASMQELAASANILAGLAAQLNQQVSRFKI